MQIHEIIEDDLSINYLIQLTPKELIEIQNVMKTAYEDQKEDPGVAAALLAHYPIAHRKDPSLKDPE